MKKNNKLSEVKNVSIIIPTYNEKKTILKVLSEIKQAMFNTKYNFEILLVEDYSTDGTRQLLRELSNSNKFKKDNIRVIEHSYNKGYGSSLKTGINNAKCDFLVMLDGDGTYPPEFIPELLKYANKYDLVTGSRVGKKVKIPLLRRPAKLILTQLAMLLTGIKIPDLNCGLRVIKKQNIKKFLHLLPERFSFTTTHLLACLTSDDHVKFVPIDYRERKSSSTIHPIKDFIRFINIIIRIVTYFRPFRMFSMFSSFLLMLAFFIWAYTFFVLGKIADITVIILISSSLQTFLFGLLADLVIKTRLKLE
jgi:glycosyltransferase involved in cell wall biosynthesis